MDIFTLDGEHLSLDDVIRVAHAAPAELQLTIAEPARERMARSRDFAEQTLASGQVAYGINTGFGAFKDRLISSEQVTELQRNIVVSHSVGVGAPLSQDVVRSAVLIRANTLARGHSGVRPDLVEALVSLLNGGVYPVLPSQGSLGASGDLAPLAHMALVLIGEGEAMYQGEKLPGGEALRRAGLSPVVLAGQRRPGAHQRHGRVVRRRLSDDP